MISIEHGSNYRCRVFRIKKQKQNNKQLGGQVSPRWTREKVAETNERKILFPQVLGRPFPNVVGYA